jgi:hypothetical protein
MSNQLKINIFNKKSFCIKVFMLMFKYFTNLNHHHLQSQFFFFLGFGRRGYNSGMDPDVASSVSCSWVVGHRGSANERTSCYLPRSSPLGAAGTASRGSQISVLELSLGLGGDWKVSAAEVKAV